MPYLPPPIKPQYTGPYCWPVKKFVWGDFDMDGEITVGDAVEIIQFIFNGRPNKGPIEAGDANCDGDTNIGDAIYLIAYIFRFGPPPGNRRLHPLSQYYREDSTGNFQQQGN